MADSLHSRSLAVALRALAEPIAARHGCELVAVELLGAEGPGRRRILRMSVDRPGGSTIHDCATISRALSPALDAEDLFDGGYELEVSTPGMDRPVQRAADFERFAGCTVRIKRYGQQGRRLPMARILACRDAIVEVETPQGKSSIPIDDIERAHLVLDFEQYARLGQGLHPITEGEPS